MSKGVVYVATGEDFIVEAETSATQLKSVMPDVDITLFADRQPEAQAIDNYIEIPNPEYDFIDKIRVLPDSPYDNTLYLDSDIYVVEPIPELFDILDQFDMAAALDAHQQPVIDSPDHEAPKIYDGRYDPMPEFNTGVLAYRNSNAVKDCFKRWQKAYNSDTQWAGQPSFLPAAYKSDIRICPLPRRYNYIVGLQNSVSGHVKIFHSRLPGGPAPGSKDVPFNQLESLIKRVNSTTDPRVTYPNEGQLNKHVDIQIRPDTSLRVKLQKTFRDNGFLGGLRRILHAIRS